MAKQELISFPPRPSTIARAIQPDYRKWESIAIGMPCEEVSAILGPPLTGREQRPIIYFFSPDIHWHFGFISYPALPSKWSMCFTIGFDAAGRVTYKGEPFGGTALSKTGEPSQPTIITPLAGSRFSHYPRIVDVRWFPCSGVYPIIYELDVGIAQPGTEDFRDHLDPQQLGQPYTVLSMPGSQPGRIRVRGRNDIGVGPWSDYRAFTFTVKRPRFRSRR